MSAFNMFASKCPHRVLPLPTKQIPNPPPECARRDSARGDCCAENCPLWKREMIETIPPQLNFPEVIHMLETLYINRGDAYGEQQLDGQYLSRKENLTGFKLEKHLRGELTIGPYQTNPKNQTVKTIGFDTDGNPNDLGPAKAVANAIYQSLLDLGVPKDSILVEFTGLKGYRPTVFLNPPINAGAARVFAEKVKTGLKLPDDVSLEVFPKQDKVEAGGFGNLVKLPFALHKKSGKRAHFVHPRDFSPLPWEVILAVKPWGVPKELLSKLGQKTSLPKTDNEPLSREDYPCWKAISTGNVPEGTRYAAGFAYARHLRDQGLSLEATLAVLEKWFERLPQPDGNKRPWGDIKKAAESSYKKIYAVGCGTIQSRWPNLCNLNCPIQQRKTQKAFKKSSATPTPEEIEEIKKKAELKATPSQEARQKALEILEHGDPIEFVGDTIQLMHKGDRELGQYIYAATLTPELGFKLHLLTVGSSGVGKSDLLRKTTRCVPENKRIKLDSLSPKSVFAATQAGIDLNGVVFYVDDADPDDDEQIKTLKMLATDDPDAIRHWTLDDKRNFADFVITRDFVVFASTIQALTDKQGQILRRYEVLNPSEDDATLKAALKHIKDSVRDGKAEEEYPSDFEVARAITWEIKNQKLKVAIPFDFDFPPMGFESKTALKKFSALVWAIAKAFFKQRIIIDNTVLAQPEDFELAVKLWAKRQPLKVDEIAMKVLMALGEEEPQENVLVEDKVKTITWDPEPTTATTLARKLKYAPRTMRDKLENLYDAGLADKKAIRGRGNPFAYWLAPETSKKIGNLDKQGEGLGRYIAKPNTLPSFDKNTLVASFNDYCTKKSKYSNIKYNLVRKDYIERLTNFISLSNIFPLLCNKSSEQKPKELDKSDPTTSINNPDADKDALVSDVGGIPQKTTTSQIDLMERLGELYNEVGGQDLTPKGFLSIAISRLSTENEDRLREAINHLSTRARFRIGENDKLGGGKT